MKIKVPSLSRLSVAEYANLLTDIKGAVIENTLVNQKVKGYFENTFIPACDLFAIAFKKQTRSLYTSKIDNAKVMRLSKYSALRAVVRGNIMKSDERISDTAKNMNLLFGEYGNFSRKSLNSQTGLIDDLLLELDTNNRSNIELLGIGDEVEELRLANTNFKNLFAMKIQEDVDKPKTSTAEMRKQIDPMIRTMCSMIDTYSISEVNIKYDEFINRINIIFKRYGAKSSPSSSKPSTSGNTNTGNGGNSGNGSTDPYPNAREWSADIDYQTCASGDIFYIVRNGVKEYYKLLDYGEVTTFEPGMDDGGIWEKL